MLIFDTRFLCPTWRISSTSQVKAGDGVPGCTDNASPGERGRAAGGSGLSRGGLTCIPLVAAASPGEVDGEAAEEVEKGPGQDDDVVHVQKDDNHLRGVADACGDSCRIGLGQRAGLSHATQPSSGGRLHSTVRALRQCWAQAPWSLISLPGR